MSDREETPVETVLGPQYGSDAADLAQGKVDIRRFTRINDAEAIFHSALQLIPNYRGGKAAKIFSEELLNLKMSVDGWRANQGIRLVAGSKGAPVVDIASKPGWFSRNLSNRKWREQREREGVMTSE